MIIAKRDKPLVKLVVLPEAQQERRLGGAADAILGMFDDFDEPLEVFQEYMSKAPMSQLGFIACHSVVILSSNLIFR